MVIELGLLAVLLSSAIPTAEDPVPPPALRVSQLANLAAPPRKIAKVHPQQVLIQETQNFVDGDGDTHVDTSPPPSRGQIGSTDHLKDDQFFLNVPFSEADFDANVDVTWVRPAAQMSKLDYIGLYNANDADDAIPCNWEFAPGEGGSGVVQLQMTTPGEMQIRYFDVAADRPRVRVNITVFEGCPNNCTNHGICSKGQCVCFAPYKGTECCEVGGQIKVDVNTTSVTVGSSIHVTLTPPVGDLDSRNWIGLFKVGRQFDTAVQILPVSSSPPVARQALIGIDAAIVANSTIGDIIEFVNLTATPPLIWRYVSQNLDIPMPYVPGTYILKVIKNVDGHPVLGASGNITVFGECPNGCSGHGDCVEGACVCYAGYNHTADCSLGDGMVQLSVHPTACLVGSLLTVTWERNSDGGFSNLDYVALFDAEDVNFDAPFAYQFAQPISSRVEPELSTASNNALVDRGSVEFTAPTAKANFVVRYFKRDHTQYAVSAPIEVYFDCVVPDCSGHGKCVKGDCICEAGWKSSDCSVGDGPVTVSCSTEARVVNSVFDVSWSRPEKVGSIFDFIALYPRNSPNDQPFMYRYASNKEGDQTKGTVTLQLPSKPGQYDVRYVDAFSRQTIAMTEAIEAHLPCPNACSGHGTCNKDTCDCNSGWTARIDCSAMVGVVQLTASPLKLETPSTDKVTVTFKRPQGSGYPEDFIGLYPKLQTDNRHPIDFAMPPSDFGTIEFSVPQYAGVYQARYVSGPDSELKAHSVDIAVTKACLNKCSQHGACNNGVCACSSGWGGLDCSIGLGPTSVTVGPRLGNPGDKILITYTRPVNNGGSGDILGIYYKGATDMSTPLGFVMATDKDSDTVESKMPSVEATLEVHYVRGNNQTSAGVSAPFNVVFPCKNACNGHGSCKLGFCTCQDGFDGFACENSVPTTFKLVLAGPTSVNPLANIPVFWEAVPKKSSASDLVALYAVTDTASASPLVYEYTSMRVNGTANLMAPYQAGQYIAKYVGYISGSAQILATSPTVTVIIPPKTCPKSCSGHGSCDTTTGDCSCSAGWGGSDCATSVPTAWGVSSDAKQYTGGSWIVASWTRPPVNTGNQNDMIGIFQQGQSQPIQYQYVGFGNQGSVTLQAPTPSSASASYVLRFVNGASGEVMASSNALTVTAPATAASANARMHKGA